MKFNVPLPVLFLVLLVSLSGKGLGQRQESISMLIDLVAWGDTIEGISLKSESKKETLTALAFTYSDSVAYKGPPVLAIYQNGTSSSKVEEPISEEDERHRSQPLQFDDEKVDPAKLDDTNPLVKELFRRREEEPTLVALVPLPSGSKRVTILLAPAAGGLLQPYLIDDDPSKLPVGKLRVHNLSRFPISMRCSGNQDIELKPGSDSVVNAQNQVVAYELKYKKGDKWITQENNLIPVRQKRADHAHHLKKHQSILPIQRRCFRRISTGAQATEIRELKTRSLYSPSDAETGEDSSSSSSADSSSTGSSSDSFSSGNFSSSCASCSCFGASAISS